MSSASQFLGGGGVPLGGTLSAPAALWGNVHAVHGQEYLKTGLLRAYGSSYASLIAASKAAGLIASAALHASWTLTTNMLTNGLTKLLFVGSNYHLLGDAGSSNAGQFTYGSSVSSAPSAQAGIATNFLLGDALVFNGGILAAGYDAGTSRARVYRSTGTTYSSAFTGTLAISERMYLAAGGSIACILRGTNGSGYVSGVAATSTDGITWTERNPSGLPNATLSRFVYSQVGTLLVAIVNGAIYTSPDGITWTSRTAPAGPTFANAIPTAGLPSQFCAANANATLISATNGYLIRSTNGTTWSAVDLSSMTANGVAPAGNLMLAWDGTRFLAFDSATNRLFYSSDDGVTWQPDFLQYQGVYSGYATQGGLDVANAKVFYHARGGSVAFVPLEITAKILQSTPDYVGFPTALTEVANVPYYMRIR